MDNWHKLAITIGLVASIITIFSFITGVHSFRSGKPSPSTPQVVEQLETEQTENSKEKVPPLQFLWLFIRFLLVIAAPLLPAGLFWLLAVENNWDWDYPPVPHIIAGVLYFAFAALCLALLFPKFGVSVQMWTLLNLLETGG